MAGPFGMTPQGFVPKTYSDIVASVQAGLRGAISASLSLEETTAWDKIIGVFAGEQAVTWEGGEEIYSSNTSDGATGVALIDYAGATGTVPLPPRQSSVTETLVGVSTSPIDAGTVLSVQGRNDSRFDTQADVVITAVPSWAGSHLYSVLGARVKNGANVYQVTQPGTSASSGGPIGNGEIIADNSVVWTYLGVGDGAIDVQCFSENFDSVSAPARTLTRIDSPANGLNSAINLEDAFLGRPVETEPVFRLRREEELRASGAAASDAIKVAVDEVDGVKNCSVFLNNEDTTDGDGVPPHSVEVVVQLDSSPPAEVEDLIRAAIFRSVSGGIRPYGQVTGSVNDANGKAQPVAFSYLTTLPAYIRLDFDVTKDFPTNGVSQILDSLVAYEVDTLSSGYDLVAFQLASRAKRDVAGIFDNTNAKVGPTSPPALSRMPVNSRQIAGIDTGRMTINTNLVVP